MTGELTPFGARQPGVAYLAGGYGNLLAQIFRRNYPNYSAGFSLNIPLRNRAAQSDYATSLIEIRQNELNLQKSVNQVEVDVQKRRHRTAAGARPLRRGRQGARASGADLRRGSEEDIDLGAATPYQVVQDQRDLASAAKLRGAGHGQLQPRPDRLRSGAGQHARSESHLSWMKPRRAVARPRCPRIAGE